MRLLYLYSEEWTGRRAREVHTLSTCVALADSGIDVTLVTAGGGAELHAQLVDVAHAHEVPNLTLVALSRTLGPIRSTSIFARNFSYWLQKAEPFDLGYIIHLKSGPLLTQAGIPYAYEAHEIFAQTPENSVRQKKLHLLEGQVLNGAKTLIATSAPLAIALITWFSLSKDFVVIPNAGLPPLENSIGDPDGPLVYCGSIADWKGLDTAITASIDAGALLKIIGGTQEEWNSLGDEMDTGGIEWHPRVELNELPGLLAGARAGLIPTNPDVPSGEFSCPMKLFDYARCGLPVITTALPSLQSLEVGSWCVQVPSPSRGAWAEAMRTFRYDPEQADAARAWATEHTWAIRADLLRHTFGLDQ
jgi:glycosyltransferase involved in cell wall biosynthesis